MSQTLEHQRQVTQQPSDQVRVNVSEEFERQRTLKRLQAYRELDLLQISEVLQTMMTVSKQCSPAVTEGDSQSMVTDKLTD